jgi:predicted helicase
MFTRFYRWSMDRLNDNGVIAFITNRTFIDGRAFDGFRKSVQNEFDSIYIVDLRSDVRANPKIAGTSHNVFGIQTGVAIAFLVKDSEKQKDKRKCKIHYIELDDFWRKEKKLEWIRENPISTIAFERIEHDAKNNWINQSDNDWDNLISLIDKEVKSDKSEEAVFKMFSLGIATHRDDWIYDKDKTALERKVKFFIKVYSQTLIDENFVDKHKIAWDADLDSYLHRRIKIKFEERKITESLFRPFNKRYFYNDKHLNSRLYQFPNLIKKDEDNLVVAFNVPASAKPFHCVATTTNTKLRK